MNGPQKYLNAVARLLNPACREIEPAERDMGASLAVVREINDADRTVTALVSTPSPDRYEEIVEVEAFREWLPVFMENPVFIAGHNYSSFNGEPTVLGQWLKMEITREGLVGTAQFDDEEPLAKRYWNLYRKRHMRAFSVGWLTHQWEMREFELAPGVTKRIRVFTEVELIEVSAVSIPANREALVRAASALAGVPGGTTTPARTPPSPRRCGRRSTRASRRRSPSICPPSPAANSPR